MVVRNLQIRRQEQGNVPTRTPGNMLTSLQDEMNDLFSNFFNRSIPSLWNHSENFGARFATPAIDVSETEKEVHVTAEIPGMDAKDVDIEINRNRINIRGEKKEERESKEQGYFHRERSYGSFQRSVTLPEYADADAAEAELKNGILRIRMPKMNHANNKSRKLEIK